MKSESEEITLNYQRSPAYEEAVRCFAHAGIDKSSATDIFGQVNFWQRELRLQDWDIVLKLKPLREMPDYRGETKYQLLKKQAIVCVLDPNDGDGNTDFPYDAEVTLVHELLHLHFVDSSHTPEECPVVFEQGVTAVSEALVRLKRAQRQ